MGLYPIPVVILARLAVEHPLQGRGIGAGLLRDALQRSLAIAELAGIRAMLAHPYDASAEQFYRRLGFEPSPFHDRQLLLLLKDARRYLSGSPITPS